MRQLWQRFFGDNPLLPRETGLDDDKPRWRAPLVVAIALAVLFTLLHLAWEIYRAIIMAGIRTVPIGVQYPERTWVLASTGESFDPRSGFPYNFK